MAVDGKLWTVMRDGRCADGLPSSAEMCQWQVADFGLSKQKQQTYVSGVSSSRGTLPWIAPEIIKSPDAVTEKVITPH
jgi:serine/threonine protein kinase